MFILTTIKILNLHILQLADLCNVTPQTIARWEMRKEEIPPDNLILLQDLNKVALLFHESNIRNGQHLVKMKNFKGKSLLDLIKANEMAIDHIEKLIEAHREMKEAYEKSGLKNSTAPKTDDWLTSFIPGYLNEK